jgi:transaldolase
MEGRGYFHRVSRLSPTRFWVNNPTPVETDLAIAAGAISCTTNPTYGMKQLQHEETRAEAHRYIQQAVERTGDDDEATDFLAQKLVKRILTKFRPLFDSRPGEQGFVSIQGNPFRDDDPDHIVAEALRYRELGPNFIAKIPVNEAGLRAIGRLIPEGVPIIATEVMGLPQSIAVCELYEKVSHRSGKDPPFYVTHITGIFDEHLQKTVRERGIDISPDILWQAGCIVARRQYQLFKKRGYPGTILGGGARDLHHFTEMVGSEMHVTINWAGTADRLIEQDPPVVWRMFNPAPDYVIHELLEKLPDFRKAYEEGGMGVSEFKDYGPVQHFRNMFLKGWAFLRDAVANERSSQQAAGRRR